jgi:hypothetical protein
MLLTAYHFNVSKRPQIILNGGLNLDLAVYRGSFKLNIKLRKEVSRVYSDGKKEIFLDKYLILIFIHRRFEGVCFLHFFLYK